ncbi:hypothetical protein K1719_021391 [Acacia pycnantha]|nr:hypothetical protein K1719_021391 [Acacia pycnantha]
MANISTMFSAYSSFFIALSLLLTLSDICLQIRGSEFGINYGQIANNLPSPTSVAGLIKSLNVSRIKLYDADPNVLSAFSGSDVEFIIGLKNEDLGNMRDISQAQSWIQQNVVPYLSQTKISTMVVGNEIFSNNDTQQNQYLVPAMKSVYNALVNLGLDQKVAVTSAHSFNILSNSYPPSSGAFREDLIPYIQPILSFHAQVKSPFLINAYPFFAYKGSPNEISLNYVLFQPNAGMVDPNTNLHYDNMLYAQIDAVYAAIKALGHSDIEVKLSETGWPSKGDADEVGASLENAMVYNANLLKRMEMKQGTPAKPSVPVDIYVFALFNENMKPGPTSERNYGLYYPDGTPVYDAGLQGRLPKMVVQSPSKSNGLFVGYLVYVITCLVLVFEISRW